MEDSRNIMKGKENYWYVVHKFTKFGKQVLKAQREATHEYACVGWDVMCGKCKKRGER